VLDPVVASRNAAAFAAVAAFYYLRVVVYMYMREPTSDAPPMRHGAMIWGGLAVASTLTIVFGLFPNSLLIIVANAAAAITSTPVAGT
jgi:NADH-quinone oxidoreductase subunit N